MHGDIFKRKASFEKTWIPAYKKTFWTFSDGRDFLVALLRSGRKWSCRFRQTAAEAFPIAKLQVAMCDKTFSNVRNATLM